MGSNDLTRRAFVSLFGAAALAGCSGGQGANDGAAQGFGDDAAQGTDEEDVKPDSATVRERASYPFDFITTLGAYDELVSYVSDAPGTVQALDYECPAYAIEAADGTEGLVVRKSLNVYLPGDYDPSRTYDVLYLLHGTGGMQDYWLGEPVTQTGDYHGAETQALLDNMHDQGLFGDVIVVAPTYYSVPEGYDVDVTFMGSMAGGDPYADEWPLHFWRELRDDIVPLVEATYPVAADRDHRGLAGLSRGSMTVVNSGMMHCMDLFAWFGCFSGAWADIGSFADALEGEFADCPVRFWYNGNGSKDFSLENHERFVAAVLERMPDRFADGENYAWVSFPGGEHAYNAWALDLHNCLLAFFG